MKRWTAMLLCLLWLAAFSACAGPETPPAESAPPVETMESAPPAPSAPAEILNVREPLDNMGVLWRIPNAYIEAGLQQHIAAFGGGLLVWGSASGADGAPVLRLALLSWTDGSLLHETELSDMENPEVTLCENRIAVNDWASGRVVWLSGELQTEQTVETGAEYCAVCPDKTGEALYVFARDGGVRVLAGAGETTLLPEALRLYPGERCGDAVTVTYVDAQTLRNAAAAVDLAAGTVAQPPFSGAFYGAERSGGVWLARAAGDGGWLVSDQDGTVFTFASEGQHASLLAESARILSASYGAEGTKFTLYSAEGAFLSACELPISGVGLVCDPLWLEEENGYLFIVTDETGSDQLFFWDLSAAVQGEDLHFAPVEPLPTHGTAVSEVLYDRAAELSERFGIRICIADLTEEEYINFTAARETRERISAALDVTERALSAYPEGFFFQLPHGGIHSIELHLTGALTKRDAGESGFTSFDGYMEQQEGKTVMAVDISGEIISEDTFHHEIMHLIDDKLTFHAWLNEDALWSEEGWAALNPAGFAYADSYNDLPANFYSDGFDGWFTEFYSRTFPREDRATVMEYAIMGEEWMFSGMPGRLAKLEYLCACIRDGFDTTGWPEMTVWEETLRSCG